MASRRDFSRHPEPGAGFSLIETLVALSLLGVAMLLTLSLIFQEPRTLLRLRAHEEAYRALEVTHEAIRAGLQVPQGRQAMDLARLFPREEPVADQLTVFSDRQAVNSSGLDRIVLTARYEVGGGYFERSLETLVWRPP